MSAKVTVPRRAGRAGLAYILPEEAEMLRLSRPEGDGLPLRGPGGVPRYDGEGSGVGSGNDSAAGNDANTAGSEGTGGTASDGAGNAGMATDGAGNPALGHSFGGWGMSGNEAAAFGGDPLGGATAASPPGTAASPAAGIGQQSEQYGPNPPQGFDQLGFGLTGRQAGIASAVAGAALGPVAGAITNVALQPDPARGVMGAVAGLSPVTALGYAANMGMQALFGAEPTGPALAGVDGMSGSAGHDAGGNATGGGESEAAPGNPPGYEPVNVAQEAPVQVAQSPAWRGEYELFDANSGPSGRFGNRYAPQFSQVVRMARGGRAGLMALGGAHGPGSRGGTGLVNSASSGRSDRVSTSIRKGSYVVPADVVSGIGQGNTLAGSKRLAGTPRLPGRARFADGGLADDMDVALSGGEHVLDPGQVAYLGGGSISRGADRLDDLVSEVRAQNAHAARSLPEPRK